MRIRFDHRRCLPGVLRGCLVEEGTLVEESITAYALRDAEGHAVRSSLHIWRGAAVVPQ